MVYLDNAATTRVSEKALEAMRDLMRGSWGNASSVHGMGLAAKGEVERARKMIGDGLRVAPERIVFTSGATEANNAALNHYAIEGERAGKRHIVVSAIEHPSVFEMCWHLKETRDFEFSVVDPMSDGTVRSEDVINEIRNDTCLVCVMAVNNETGAVQPSKELALLCEERSIPYHCDATQAVGHMEFGEGLEWASFSFSAHKFHGGKGVGALVLPSRTYRFNKLLHGGPQEDCRRSGTENVEGIVGMTVALWESSTNEFYLSEISNLKRLLWNGLEKRVGGVVLNAMLDGSVPHILNVSFDWGKGDVLVQMLSEVFGIYCSTGSACCAGESEPSHVLKSMGLSDERSLSAVRFSLSRFNTVEEIEYVIKSVLKCKNSLTF